MKPSLITLSTNMAEIRKVKQRLAECKELLENAKTSDDIENSLKTLDTPYLQRVFLERAEYLSVLEKRSKKIGYKPISTLTLFLENSINSVKLPLQKGVRESLLENAISFSFTIILDNKSKILPPVDTGDNLKDIDTPKQQDPDEGPEFKEYDSFIEILQEYTALGDSYFLKDLEENAIKDTATAISIKKKQFDAFVDNTVNKMLDDYREARKKETHENLCKRSIKLSKILTHLIIAFPLWCVNPGLAILSVIIPVIINKNTDSYYRTKMATELATEEKILDEKIKDADSLGDKGKKDKIKLMRLKDKVAVEREQIERGWA